MFAETYVVLAELNLLLYLLPKLTTRSKSCENTCISHAKLIHAIELLYLEDILITIIGNGGGDS